MAVLPADCILQPVMLRMQAQKGPSLFSLLGQGHNESCSEQHIFSSLILVSRNCHCHSPRPSSSRQEHLVLRVFKMQAVSLQSEMPPNVADVSIPSLAVPSLNVQQPLEGGTCHSHAMHQSPLRASYRFQLVSMLPLDFIDSVDIYSKKDCLDKVDLF